MMCAQNKRPSYTEFISAVANEHCLYASDILLVAAVAGLCASAPTNDRLHAHKDHVMTVDAGTDFYVSLWLQVCAISSFLPQPKNFNTLLKVVIWYTGNDGSLRLLIFFCGL